MKQPLHHSGSTAEGQAGHTAEPREASNTHGWASKSLCMVPQHINQNVQKGKYRKTGISKSCWGQW